MIILLEDIATVLIIVMAGWISSLFWRGYARDGGAANALLSAAFAIVCVYKVVQFFFEGLLSVESLEWMENEVASEGLIVLLAVVIILVLTGVGAGRHARHNY